MFILINFGSKKKNISERESVLLDIESHKIYSLQRKYIEISVT